MYQTRCRYLNKLYIWMLLAAILGSKEQRTRHSTQLFVGHNWIAKCFVAKSSSFVVFPQKDQSDGSSITIYTESAVKMYFIYVARIKYIIILQDCKRWILQILIYLNNGNANTIYLFVLTTDFEQSEVGDTYQSAI